MTEPQTNYCLSCGEPSGIWNHCDACHIRQAKAIEVRELQRYRKAPRTPWVDGMVLHSRATSPTRFFYNLAELREYIGDKKELSDIEALRLMVCAPNCLSPLSVSYFQDDIVGNPPPALIEAIRVFNATIDAMPPLSWEPMGVALDLSTLPETF